MLRRSQMVAKRKVTFSAALKRLQKTKIQLFFFNYQKEILKSNQRTLYKIILPSFGVTLKGLKSSCPTLKKNKLISSWPLRRSNSFRNFCLNFLDEKLSTSILFLLSSWSLFLLVLSSNPPHSPPLSLPVATTQRSSVIIPLLVMKLLRKKIKLFSCGLLSSS